MTQVGKNSLDTRSSLEVGGKTYAYYSLAKAAEKIGDVSRLPFSMKVLLENLLRFEDAGFTVSIGDVQALADWLKSPITGKEIQSPPARVLSRTSPACRAWSTSRRCATPLPSSAAIPARSTRWCRCCSARC